MMLFVPAFPTLMLATVPAAAESTGSVKNDGISKLASIPSFTSECHTSGRKRSFMRVLKKFDPCKGDSEMDSINWVSNPHHIFFSSRFLSTLSSTHSHNV